MVVCTFVVVVVVVERSWDFGRFERSVDHGMLGEHRPCQRLVCRIVSRLLFDGSCCWFFLCFFRTVILLSSDR